MIGYIKFYEKVTPLMEAIRNNSFEKVKKLIEEGHDIHESDEGAIFVACVVNNKEILEYLIDNGANVHFNYGQLLGCAAAHGHHDMINFLLDKGLDIHTERDYPLLCALASKKYDTVLFLLEKGASYIKYLTLVKHYNLEIPKIYEAKILSFIDSHNYSLTYRQCTIKELNEIDEEINLLKFAINADLKKYSEIVSKLNSKIKNLENNNIININIDNETLRKEKMSKKITHISKVLELLKLELNEN